MSWLRDDAEAIRADLETGSILHDDLSGVIATIISIIDTDLDQKLTLANTFTVAAAEDAVDEYDIDFDRVLDRAYSTARNMTNGALLLRRNPEYPQGLMRMERPPHVLYTEGDLSLLDAPLYAVVGSRKINGAQADVIRELGAAVGPVVSGCAPGTDHEAMTGSLDDGKPAVGVLGSGLNWGFGPHSHDLVRRLATEGLVVSEYPLGVNPVGQRLLRRNEIIAGLSSVYIVCSAEFKSGSYSGLRRAEKMGVPILAMPGSPALDDWLSRHPDRQVTQVNLFPPSDTTDFDPLTMELPEFASNPFVDARRESALAWEEIQRKIGALT